MAWIEYHTALRDHWKIQRLANAISVNYNEALGAISCLWLWAAEYAKNGDLRRFTNEEIRFGARTTCEKFTKQTLEGCGLLTGGHYINDWGKYGLKLLELKRKANREYAKRNRKSGYPQDIHSVAIPYHTIPNHTKPNKEDILAYFLEKKSTQKEADKFFNFYESNGWKVGKNPMKNWKAAASGWLSRNGFGVQELPKEAREVKRNCTICGQLQIPESQFIKNHGEGRCQHDRLIR